MKRLLAIGVLVSAVFAVIGVTQPASAYDVIRPQQVDPPCPDGFTRPVPGQDCVPNNNFTVETSTLCVDPNAGRWTISATVNATSAAANQVDIDYQGVNVFLNQPTPFSNTRQMGETTEATFAVNITAFFRDGLPARVDSTATLSKPEGCEPTTTTVPTPPGLEFTVDCASLEGARFVVVDWTVDEVSGQNSTQLTAGQGPGDFANVALGIPGNPTTITVEIPNTEACGGTTITTSPDNGAIAPTTPTASTPPSLPATGANNWLIAAFAALMLLAGTGLMALTRRSGEGLREQPGNGRP